MPWAFPEYFAHVTAADRAWSQPQPIMLEWYRHLGFIFRRRVNIGTVDRHEDELVFNLTYRGESFKAVLSKGEWREAIEQWADGVDERAARQALAAE